MMKVQLNRLVLAQSIDAATFLWFYLFVAVGSVHAERNPLVLAIMAIGGPLWGLHMVGFTKIGLSLLVRHRSLTSRKPLSLNYEAFRFAILALATASGITGAGFNIASIIHTWS